MKTKGIPFWEQHLEHFVLGAAALVFLGFTAMQFVGNPNAVQLGANTYTPKNVDERLRTKAEEISAKLSNPGSGASQIPDPVQLMPQFEKQLAASIAPSPTLPAFASNISPGQGADKITTGVPFVVAQVPAPFELHEQQFMDTLVPETIENFPDLKEVAPEAPHDIKWVTISGKFNIGSVRKQFAEKGPKGESALPTGWHNDRADTLDIKMYREELVDGNWTDKALVKHIPGQYNLRETLAGPIDRTRAFEVLNEVADPATRQDIIQPEFYLGKVPAWVAPTKAQLDLAAAVAAKGGPAAGEEENPVAGLQRKLARLTVQRDHVLAQMKEINCTEEAPPPPPPKTGPGGDKGGGGAAPPSGPQEGSGPGMRVPGGDKNKGKCDQLRKQLNKIKENIAKLEAEIAKLLPDEPPKEEKVEVVAVSTELPDEIMIWAHDINVTSGKTYRYQFVVEMYNPLFGHKADLLPEQHKLADQFTLASDASEWSDPITVNTPLQVFITAARLPQEGNALASSSTATAEVYRFRDGKTWMERFTLQLGDRVGGESSEKGGPVVNFDTEWFLLDVTPNALASKDELRDGYGALALLQNISTGEIMQVRNPRSDMSNPERIRLKDEVELAKPAEAVASN